MLEIRLSKADWLAGDKYTIADMANYAWTRAGSFLDIDMSAFPGMERWLKRIGEREAVVRANKVPEGKLSDEKMAEMFKSMKERVDGLRGTEKDEESKM